MKGLASTDIFLSLLYGQDVTTVIVLINGQEIKGKIIDQGQYLIIETDKGRMKTIYYNKIDYILTDSSLEPVEKVLERRSSRPQKNPKTAPGHIPSTYATFLVFFLHPYIVCVFCLKKPK